MDRVFQTLDRGGTDLKGFSILQIPGDAFRAKVPFSLDHLRCTLFGRRRQPPARPSRRCTFGHTRQAMSLAHPLNGAGTWGICPQPLADLVGTQGWMTLARSDNLLLLIIAEPVV